MDPKDYMDLKAYIKETKKKRTIRIYGASCGTGCGVYGYEYDVDEGRCIKPKGKNVDTITFRKSLAKALNKIDVGRGVAVCCSGTGCRTDDFACVSGEKMVAVVIVQNRERFICNQTSCCNELSCVNREDAVNGVVNDILRQYADEVNVIATRNIVDIYKDNPLTTYFELGEEGVKKIYVDTAVSISHKFILTKRFGMYKDAIDYISSLPSKLRQTLRVYNNVTNDVVIDIKEKRGFVVPLENFFVAMFAVNVYTIDEKLISVIKKLVEDSTK